MKCYNDCASCSWRGCLAWKYTHCFGECSECVCLECDNHLFQNLQVFNPVPVRLNVTNYDYLGFEVILRDDEIPF